MATTRERLHELLDTLLDEQLGEAETMLRSLASSETLTKDVDPLLDVLMNAPEDDEPLTDEDIAAIAEGKADIERGDVVRWEDYNPNRIGRGSQT
jgi:hypothetical protein